MNTEVTEKMVEALRRIRDYATPGYRNMASAELALDGVYKAACDALKPTETSNLTESCFFCRATEEETSCIQSQPICTGCAESLHHIEKIK